MQSAAWRDLWCAQLDCVAINIVQSLKLDPSKRFYLALDPKGDHQLVVDPHDSLAAVGIKHGDMLFVFPHPSLTGAAAGGASQTGSSAATSSSAVSSSTPIYLVKQDPVDDYLEKQVGTIKRGRDPNFCRHGSSGMCEYCLPLQPYDAKYLEQNKIKHMSFHAYLRQLMEQSKTLPPSNPQFIPPLDNFDFKVKDPCPSKTHAPFPEGICTKCQPSAITLQSQSFRTVDHVEFESPAIIDSFLQFWRSTGSQRAGIMYGRYEPYSEVPLGVKAVVSAIYEPMQENRHDTIQLAVPDEGIASADAVAASLGLVRVGMIYTDLTDDGSGKSTVICKRHADSYFLSSAECIFASFNQAEHPMITKYSESRTFGSRFVTCVISGNTEGGIDIFSYQVSNMCVAMARDGIIEASTDPKLMRVCESTELQYVPEVFYKYKNEYNIMVKNAAKPTFPVEYLLVTITHGFPSEPNPTFTNVRPFPIENRLGLERARDMSALKEVLALPNLMQALSDFHVLLLIKDVNILDAADFELLAQAIKLKSDQLAAELMERVSWNTLVMIAQQTASAPSRLANEQAGSSSGSSAPAARAAPRACKYCTFVNAADAESCEMCGLPTD
eukprot:jgi/Hompol1/5053/HPOL_001877-RA